MPTPRMVGQVLERMRRGRRVWWTYPGVNFGNFLYMWAHAHNSAIEGRDEYVLVQESAMIWMKKFPAMADLSLTRSEVNFFDQRLLGEDFSAWGRDYSASTLSSFIRERLVTEPWFIEGGCTTDEDLVINVRRGDYYSVDRFRRVYGFDQVSYIRRAVAASIEDAGRPSRIFVISDGLDWCRGNLSWLGEVASLKFGSLTSGPFADFAAVANARRLILSNSSFSYWGGYVSDVLHPGSESSVVAPLFHRKDINNGDAWQLKPQWTILSEPPGGWGGGD